MQECRGNESIMIVKFKSFFRNLHSLDAFELGISGLLVLLAIHFSGSVLVNLNLGSSYLRAHESLITFQSLIYAFMGIFAFGVGYWFVAGYIGGNKGLVGIQQPWKWERAIYMFFGLLGAGFAIKFYHIFTGAHLRNMYIAPTDPLFFFKFFISLNSFHFMALTLGFTCYYALLKEGSSRAKIWCFLAWGTFSFEILCGFLTGGGRLSTLIPILLFLITKHYLYEKSLMRIIVAGLLIFLVLFPVKHVLRDTPSVLNQYFGGNLEIFPWLPTFQPKDPILALSQKEMFELERYQRLRINSANAWELTTDSGFGRIAQGHVFGVIVERTTDYFYGRPLLFIVHQIGVPNSVIETIAGVGTGTEFGRKYGLVDDFYTAVGPTTMGDWYLNFGLVGVVLGMGLYGIFFKKICCSLIGTISPTGILMYSLFWIVLMHGLEQSMSASLGKLLQTFLILLLVHFGLTFKWPGKDKLSRPPS